MRQFRVSLRLLMAIVALVSLAVAALRNPTQWSRDATYTTTVLVLSVAFVGMVTRRGRRQRFWAGFAVFGWGYLGHYLVFASSTDRVRLPGLLLIPLIDDVVILGNEAAGRLRGFPYYMRLQTTHFLAALLCGLMGGLVARAWAAPDEQG